MVYISKTLLPGKTPIGSATGGGYMYDDKDRPASTFSSTQNMSVPGQNMSFTPKQQPVSPFIQSIGKIPGVGDTPITPFAPSVGFSPERAKQINAPVQDTLNFRAKINEADDRVKKLREHFRSLEQKGNFQLNKKQSDYIKKFKVKHPSYANVPDVSLYSKIILAEPKAMEQYGNIGEKGFLQNFAETPFNIAKSGAETVQRYADRYSQDVVKGGGGAFDTLAAIGGATGGVVMDVVGNTLNIASPLLKRDNSRFATSITEGLGADVKAAIPETVLTTIDDLSKKYPTIAEYVEKGLDISNLIPFLGVLGKAKGAGEVDDILRTIKTRPATKFRGPVSQEVFDAGQSKGVLGGLSTAGKNTKKALTPDFISKDAPTLKAEKIRQGFETQNTNLKSVGNAHKKNTKTYTLDDGTKETVTPIDTLEKYDIAPEVTDKTIKMGDYKATQEGALGKIQDNIEQIGVDIDTKLVNSGKKVSLAEMKAKAEAAIKSDPDLRASGKVASTLKKLDDRFEDYANSYGDELDVMEINNIRKVANKDWSPDTTDVSQIVGDVSRDIVYNSTDDIAVRNLLREQGNLLAARKYAEAINGTRVVGGRLGQAIWRGIGTTIGASLAPVLGPLAPFGGLAVGEAIGKISAASQFKSLGGELKGLFSKTKNGGAGLPKPKVKPQVKASIVSRVPKAEANQMSSGSLPSSTKSVSNEQKLLPMPKLPQVESGKSISPSQLPKEKSISAGNKVNTPIIQKLKENKAKNSIIDRIKGKKTEVKANLPKTPQVEGKTLEQGTFGGVKGVKPSNQAKFNQGDNFEPVRVVMNDKDARIVRYGAIRGRGLKKGFTTADNAEMKGILDELGISREEAINRSDEIKKLAREARSAKEEVILDLTKKKSSLPLSQKSEVKYSELDSLVQEAKKYKSAEEFVKAQGKPMYHGSDIQIKEFNLENTGSNINNRISRQGVFFAPDASGAEFYAKQKAFIKENGYAKLTRDNLKNSTIKGEVTDAYISNNAKITEFDFEGSKDWDLLNAKITELKKQGFDVIKINNFDDGTPVTNQILVVNPKAIKTKQQLVDIFNKSKKSSLPMSAKSEVKYSKPENTELLDFMKKQKVINESSSIWQGKAKKIAEEYPDGFGGISNEGRALPETKEVLKNLEYYTKMLKDFNSSKTSKEFIKKLGKMNIVERMALRKSLK